MVKLQPHPQPKDGPADGPTACIVTCHNYGRYLTSCMLSLLAQHEPFDDIVIVLDACTDESERIAKAFKPSKTTRVSVVRVNFWNACKARNAGVSVLKQRPRFYLFMDSDNTVPRNYHHALRLGMVDPAVAIVYPKLVHCDALMQPTGQVNWQRTYSHDKLRRMNYIDTASLVRAEAFHMVGGWDEHCHGLQDWNLWVRITGLGWRADSANDMDGCLNYREHDQSMTSQHRADGTHESKHVQSVQRSQRLTIVTLFSGRSWQLPRYFEILERIDWLRDHVDIVAIDNSGDKLFNRMLLTTLVATGLRFTVHTEDRQACTQAKAAEGAGNLELRRDHTVAINEHLAYLYALAGRLMPTGTDLVWCLEDDVEPEPNALPELVRGLIRDHKAGVVCGVVANRFGNRHLLAWDGGYDRGAQQLKDAPAPGKFRKVTGSGFMCTLFRAEVYRKLTFRGSPHWNPHRRPYYDWAAAMDVESLGWKWLIAGAVRCGHREPSGECVHPGHGTDSKGEDGGCLYDY